MDISLSPELEMLVQQKVADGYYKSPDDVIKAGLLLLHNRDEEKLKALRADILAAHEQLSRGEKSPLDMEAIIAIGKKGRAEREEQ